MESNGPSPPGVKQIDANFEENFTGEIPDAFPAKIPKVECENLCRRIDGYLHGCFLNGLLFIEEKRVKAQFARTTQYSWRHICDVFPKYKAWTTNFRFKRLRIGRSWVVHIYPVRRLIVLSAAEVRRRLIGAITSYLAQSHKTGVHVDRLFLEGFHARFGMDPLKIFYAWRTLQRIDGYACNWRGRGNGKNFYVQKLRVPSAGKVSHPENASGISPPTGGNNMKTGDASRPGLPDRKSGSLRSLHGVKPRFRRSTPPPGEDDFRPSGFVGQKEKPPNRAAMDRANHRWLASSPPLLVGERWIPGKRLHAKAKFLTFGPIQGLHGVFPLVRFRVAHAMNFCEAALRAGFLDSEICAAWRAGLEEAQVSGERDRAAAGLGEWSPREPSQVVARAWLRLRSDTRSDRERWEAIFRGDRTPQKNFPEAENRAVQAARDAGTYYAAAPAAAVDGGGGEGGVYGSPAAGLPNKPAEETNTRPRRGRVGHISRVLGPGLRVPAKLLEDQAAPPAPAQPAPTSRPEKLPVPAKELLRADVRFPSTIEAHLAARGLTLPELLKLPRDEQKKFVREALAAQKKAPRGSENP